jgi:crossover junction endodeoxyribonuclease RusA
MTPDRLKQITVTLPIPPKELSPNARVHWAKKAKLTASLRELACVRALFVIMANGCAKPQWEKASVLVEWFHRTAMHPDPDNCRGSLKAVYDGMQSAGVYLNDRYLTHLPIIFAKDASNPRVVLTITPTGEKL